MKLLSRDDGRFVFLIAPGERDLLLTLLGMDGQLPRRPRPLSRGVKGKKLVEEEAQLHTALDEFRAGLYEGMRTLLTDEKTCVPGKGGFALTLDRAQIEQMLQAVNGLRLGAWERMGAPDFEVGERPKPGPETDGCISIMRVTDLLLAHLLAALHDES